MSFASPWFLLLIPLYWLCERYCRAASEPLRLSNLPLAERALGRAPHWKRWLRWLIVIQLVLTLADPVTRKSEPLNRAKGHAVALLLDASYSMREGGRFDIAKKVLLDFIDRRKNDRIALEIFADYAYLAAPMSFEKKGLKTILEALEPGVVGGRDTALYEALFKGVRLFEKEEEQSNRVMVLLADGIDTVGNLPLEAAIRELKRAHIRVHTIGVGDDFRREVLEKIAQATGGSFNDARRPEALADIYRRIDTLESARIKTGQLTQTHHYAAWLLWPSLGLLLWLAWLRRHQRVGALAPLLASALLLWALLAPRLGTGKSEDRRTVPLLVAIECSKAMDAGDLYPDRFRFALHKVRTLIGASERLKVGLLLFCGRSYLLAPPTTDREALETMLDHLRLEGIDCAESDWSALIRSAARFREGNGTLPLLVFATGEGIEDPALLAEGAKKRRLDLILYAAATPKGATLPEGKGLLRDERGDVIVSRLSPDLRRLAEEAGGEYLGPSLDDGDMEHLAAKIVQRYSRGQKGALALSTEQAPPRWPILLALALLFLPWTAWMRGRR
jgi:Ca-activated chloride channel family protein